MAWQGIEGHDAVAAAFAAADRAGRLAGAYLFVGPPGVGKGAFARALAKALVCLDRRPGLAACGGCVSCVQADAGSHPDIDIVARPEDRATIPLESFVGDAAHRMREGLCWRILLRPALGPRRVAIVLDADHLGDEAANCLLKTLEEPPAGAAIFLVGTGPERQLPTIRSRCRTVRFGPLPADTVRRLVEAELSRRGEEADAATIAAAAAAAGGSLDRALVLMDPEVGVFRGRLLELLARRPLAGVELGRETNGFVEAAGKDAPPRRARLALALDAAVDFFRAAIRHAANGELPAEPAVARGVAAWAADADEATAALENTLDARDAIDRNAHLPTLIDAWTAVLETPRLAHSS